MTSSQPVPALVHARAAAEDYLMSAGFRVVTRTLSDHRRADGMSPGDITEAYQRRLIAGRAAGDPKAVTAAGFTLAVWDGMQRDLAEWITESGDQGTRNP